jgi:hypothetical protein
MMTLLLAAGARKLFIPRDGKMPKGTLRDTSGIFMEMRRSPGLVPRAVKYFASGTTSSRSTKRPVRLRSRTNRSVYRVWCGRPHTGNRSRNKTINEGPKAAAMSCLCGGDV